LGLSCPPTPIHGFLLNQQHGTKITLNTHMRVRAQTQTDTSTLHQPPAPLQHQGGERLCRLDINIQCAVKAKTTVNTACMKSWLCLTGAETLTQHTTKHAHARTRDCGLSWAKESSRGVLKLTNLYETNTIHTKGRWLKRLGRKQKKKNVRNRK
uniref:Uncharacterized protein n=1 Tax=Haplochromis burtoni TaxID=8153 RepID=A0A3Q2VZT3_HAPBU